MVTEIRVLKIHYVHLFFFVRGGSFCKPISNMHIETALFCGRYLGVLSYSQKCFHLMQKSEMWTSGVLTAPIGVVRGSISVTGGTLKHRWMQKQKNLEHPFLE